MQDSTNLSINLDSNKIFFILHFLFKKNPFQYTFDLSLSSIGGVTKLRNFRRTLYSKVNE